MLRFFALFIALFAVSTPGHAETAGLYDVKIYRKQVFGKNPIDIRARLALVPGDAFSLILKFPKKRGLSAVFKFTGVEFPSEESPRHYIRLRKSYKRYSKEIRKDIDLIGMKIPDNKSYIYKFAKGDMDTGFNWRVVVRPLGSFVEVERSSILPRN